MSTTNYNIEINFTGKRWEYIYQVSSLKWALMKANSSYNKKAGPRRIRKVVKTIVWKSKKDE